MTINEQIELLVLAKDSLVHSIKVKTGDGSNTVLPFIEYANEIYNLYNDGEKKVFVNPDEVIINSRSIENTLKNLHTSKIYIENAIRAIGIDLKVEEKTENLYMYIDNLHEQDINRLDIVNCTTEPVEGRYYASRITLTGDESYYKFADIDEPYPLKGTTQLDPEIWEDLSTGDIITREFENNDFFITVIGLNEDGEVISAGRVKLNYNKRINCETNELIHFDYSTATEYGHANISLIKDIGVDSKIYFKEFNYEIANLFVGETLPNIDQYNIWDKVSQIDLGDNLGHKYLFVETDGNDKCISCQVIYVEGQDYVPSIEVQCYAGILNGETVILINDIKSDNNRFILVRGEMKRPLLNSIYDQEFEELYDELNYVKAEEGEVLHILVIDIDNKVKAYTSINAHVEKLRVPNISLSSSRGNVDNGTIIYVNSERVDETGESKYYYKILEDTTLIKPTVGSIINEEYISWDEQSEIIVKDHTYIMMVEVNSDNEILAAGFISVYSKIPVSKTFRIHSEIGQVTGYTKITPDYKLQSDEVFMYSRGNNIVEYDMEADYRWTRWDGESEIYGFKDDETITMIVAQLYYGVFKVRSVALCSVLVRPVELIPLSIISVRGSEGSKTRIICTPRKDFGNIYRYNFTKELPDLYDDVSDWIPWDGYSEILAPGMTDEPICIAECDRKNKVLKTGYTLLVVRDPDPVLEPLTLSSVASVNNPGCTKITVSPTLRDGYQYAYKFTEEMPKIMDSAADWSYWNGKDEIKAELNASICIAECTTDGFIVKAGIITCNINTN